MSGTTTEQGTTNGAPRVASMAEARAFLAALPDDDKPARKPRARKAPRTDAGGLVLTTTTHEPRAAGRPTVAPSADPLMRWAKAGIGLTVGLSALLNGYANAEHCAPGMAWAGWGLGICVPALVLILARVAGGAWLRGRRILGAAGAAVVLALLGLSVRHCAHTFAALTGSDGWSATAWAIGVDAGLVVCELVTITRRGK